MTPTVKHRINFYFEFRPNAKPTTVHVDFGEVSDAAIKKAFMDVASYRYPTMFNTDAAPLMYNVPLMGGGKRFHIGDPAGINAVYTVQTVLECGGKFFELKELPI